MNAHIANSTKEQGSVADEMKGSVQLIQQYNSDSVSHKELLTLKLFVGWYCENEVI